MPSIAPYTTPGVDNNGNGHISCCWKVLHFWNTFAVAILTAAVVFLFVQLQYINYTLKQEQDRLNDVLQEVRSQQHDQIQQLSQQVQQDHSLTIYQMAGTFTLLVALITIFHMSSHLRSYTQPIVQRRILAILWMSPIYSATSFLSLVFPRAGGYLSVLRDFYEAYIIYTFLALLIAILGKGDRREAVRVLSLHADHLQPPSRCFRALFQPLPDSRESPEANATHKADSVMTECQVLALQFVLIRPITSLMNFVISELEQGDGETSESSPLDYFVSIHFILDILTNVSVFLAFTGLLKFYHAVQDDLDWCKPFSKFMAIKGIVFLTFWQGLLITILVHLRWSEESHGSHSGYVGQNGAVETDSSDLVNNGTRWIQSMAYNQTSGHTNTAQYATQHSNSPFSRKSPQEQASEIQNVLICLEMLLFSIAHWCVFPAEEWEPNYRPRNYASPSMGLKDFASDVGYLTNTFNRARTLRKRQPLSTDDSSDEMYGSTGKSVTGHDDENDNHSTVTSPTARSDTEADFVDVEDHVHRTTLT
jgi:cell division protein FtsL